MSQDFIGQIKMVGFNFAPQGWSLCDGQLLPISENDALFSLIGTIYGGDGQQTFALPDLRGRRFQHSGTPPGGRSWTVGEQGGQETVALTSSQLPNHTHAVAASSHPGTTASPAGNYWAGATGPVAPYSSTIGGSSLNSTAVTPFGGGQAHENMAPYLVVNFIICLYGIYPSRS